MSNPTQFQWVAPTTNVDGSPIAAGEITGYTIGIRANGSAVGTYTMSTAVTDPTATSEPFANLSSVLVAGDYFAAIATNAGSVNSSYSNEVAFTIAAAAPAVPNAPTGFTVV